MTCLYIFHTIPIEAIAGPVPPIISSCYLIPVGCLQEVVVDVTCYPPMKVVLSTPALAKNVIIGMLFVK